MISTNVALHLLTPTNEALQRKPENCIIGDFTNEEMQAERIRQFKLYEHALECVLEDGINKVGFNIQLVIIVPCMKL